MFDRTRLNQMLTDLNERIQGAVVNGVNKFQNFDDAYAQRVHDFVYPEGTKNPALGILSGYAGQPVTRGMPPSENTGLARALDYSIPVSNVAVRYGMPIAGVTAAGQGLYALGQALVGEPQDKGTLPLS
jgi:hypothetical protein